MRERIRSHQQLLVEARKKTLAEARSERNKAVSLAVMLFLSKRQRSRAKEERTKVATVKEIIRSDITLIRPKDAKLKISGRGFVVTNQGDMRITIEGNPPGPGQKDAMSVYRRFLKPLQTIEYKITQWKTDDLLRQRRAEARKSKRRTFVTR